MDFYLVCRRCYRLSPHLRRTFSSTARLPVWQRIDENEEEVQLEKRGPTRHKTGEMFWEDTKQIFGKQLPSAKLPPFKLPGFDPAKGKRTFKEWKQMTSAATKVFNDHSALLYGRRLRKVPESLDTEHHTLPLGKYDPIEFVVTQAGYIANVGPFPGVQDPTGGTEELAKSVVADDLLPSGAAEVWVEVQKQKPVRYVREDDMDWTKAESYYDPSKMIDLGNQKWRSRTPFAEVKTVNPPTKRSQALDKSDHAGSGTPKTRDVVHKSKPSFRVVVLKREADLKSLVQAPMLNRLRPDYEDSPDGMTLPTPMVLQISPSDLTTLDISPHEYPSVTTILDVTMPPDSRQRLEKWEKAKIAELGIDGFKEYKQGKATAVAV